METRATPAMSPRAAIAWTDATRFLAVSRATGPAGAGPTLGAERLSLAYDERRICDDLTVEIPHGKITVVVGANEEDGDAASTASDSGAAYVFVRDTTVTPNTWTEQAYLKASNADPIDEFGYSVAVSGDTVVVGANRDDSIATGVNGNQANNSASDAGAAYVFDFNQF